VVLRAGIVEALIVLNTVAALPRLSSTQPSPRSFPSWPAGAARAGGQRALAVDATAEMLAALMPGSSWLMAVR